MGSFALFLLIAMGLWTTVLWFCKDELISNRQSLSQTDTQPLQSAKNSTSFIPSAPPVKSTSTSINTHEELPLHQQDDVVDVDLDDDTEAF